MVRSSFCLLILSRNKPGVVSVFEKVVVNQWISSFPSANLSLLIRLFYGFLEEFNR